MYNLYNLFKSLDHLFDFIIPGFGFCCCLCFCYWRKHHNHTLPIWLCIFQPKYLIPLNIKYVLLFIYCIILIYNFIANMVIQLEFKFTKEFQFYYHNATMHNVLRVILLCHWCILCKRNCNSALGPRMFFNEINHFK